MKTYNYILYLAKNNKNGKIYVGATTTCVDKRRLDHEVKANNGKVNKFHKAISTYGAGAFSWEQIDTANSIDELALKEKQYILEFNSKEEGYNTDSGGGFKKTVYQYNLIDGSLIESYDCLENAANVVNATKQDISRACLSVNNTYKGFYWSYKYITPFKPKEDKRKKKVIFYNLEEVTVQEFDSVADASRETGVSKSCIAKYCRGEMKPLEYYRWNYK